MDQTVRAPELESPLGWLNTDRPLRISHELKGQVVVLDFWTYCCINCIHILPDLKYLEAKYADAPLAVIGVHSAKFANESSRQTISSAIHRYEIEHPVIVDDCMKLWQSYGVRSWPTFAVIDPEGYVVAMPAGEGNRDVLESTIGQLLEQHRAKGTLADAPLTLQRDAAVEPASGLAFPGKVLADGECVFISDSNHNRIIVTTLPDSDGHCTLLKIVGSGEVGNDDGSAESATFDHPQGLARMGDRLYVADTENHLIRAVDLNSWSVTTVIGTGEMGNDRAGGAMGVQQAISSPWDLVSEGGTLYIAMAGIHQIWRAEMPIGFARALAGSGRENIVDGPVETAALSQPSGICLHKGNLYFADSEVSAIRGVDLATEQVFTVIGEGLFVFGDEDGAHPKARLQHCLGVTSWHDKLLVADTYNHKVKAVDPQSRSATTLYGTGAPAGRDGARPAFYEPGGLHAAGDTLLVADTNNHRIVYIDLTTHAWSELKIDGLAAPSGSNKNAGDVIEVAEQVVSLGSDTALALNVTLPAGAHLNAEAPWTVRVSTGGNVLSQETGHSGDLPITARVPASAPKMGSAWEVALSIVYCTDGDGALCVPADITWRVPVKAGEQAGLIKLSAAVGAENAAA